MKSTAVSVSAWEGGADGNQQAEKGHDPLTQI